MSNKYTLNTYMRDARPRSQRLRDLGGAYTGSSSSTIIISSGSSGSGSDVDLSSCLSSVYDDTAAGHITFEDGITVKGQATLAETITNEIHSETYDDVLQQGFHIYTDANGRGIGRFNTVEVEEFITDVLTYNQISAIGGEFVASMAWATMSRYTIIDVVVRIYYEPDDGLQMWEIGDQPRMAKAGRYFWGIVTDVSASEVLTEHWFECAGIDKDVDYIGQKDFVIGDTFVLYGSRQNTARQGLLIFSAAPSVSVYYNVNSFSITEDNLIKRITPTEELWGNEYVGGYHYYLEDGKMITKQWIDEHYVSTPSGYVDITELLDTNTTEYIYTLSATDDKATLPELTNSTESSYVPDGWFDDMQSVSSSTPYQFATYRKKENGVWGDFGEIILYNTMGVSGRSAATIYQSASSKPSTPTSLLYPPEGWSTTAVDADDQVVLVIDYIVNSEKNYDKLYITDNYGNTYVDGVSSESSGVDTYGAVTITLSRSTTLTIRYEKDEDQSFGGDNVKFRVSSYTNGALSYTVGSWSLIDGYYTSNSIGNSESTEMYIDVAMSVKQTIWACTGVWGDSLEHVNYWGDVVQWSGSAGESGEDAITATTYSSNGNIFNNGNVETTLSAHVFKGGEEITDLIHSSCFNWTRTSDDTEGDAAWGELKGKGIKSIDITIVDVYKKAVFNWTVESDLDL